MGSRPHPTHPENPVPVPGDGEWWRRNARLIDWRIKERIELHKKYFFVASTITRLRPEQCDQIRQAYLKKHFGLKKTLDDLFGGVPEVADVSDPTLAEDLRKIINGKIDTTTKDALVSARLGQGRFRAEVLQLWGNRCAVTKSITLDAIRASHIKPWCESTDEERLDPSNGLPLIASLDALFDAGLISFDSSGKLIVASELTTSERHIFGIGAESLTKKPTAKTAKYLAYHRANCFQG
jgi:hypothetical protein